MLDDRHAAVLDAALKARESRQNWMNLWQELAEVFLPQRADFTAEQIDGAARDDGLFSSEPQLSARGLQSAINAMLRPAGKMWFKAKTKDAGLMASEAVRAWLYMVTQITYDALYDPRVNADKMLSEVDYDLVVFGTGIGKVDWNKGDEHLIIQSRSLANTCLLTGRDGNPNAVFSFTKPTLRQIVEEFGVDKLTTKMREAYFDNGKPRLDECFEIVHCCIPNLDWQAYGASKGKGRFPYHSVWLSVACQEKIDESGYYSFPYITPRWDTLTGEIYGRSPAMVALPDARIVLAMSKTFLEAGEFSLRPPTYSYADMIRGELELYPGGHTYVDMTGFQGSGDPIKALQLGAFPDKIYEVYQAKSEAVAAAFFRDILELPSARDKDMTATEINARLDQYLRQAAPIFARLNDNYNAPLVNRVFEILMREKRYPPMPEEMFGENGEFVDIEFEYESPIKAAREKAEALKVVEGLQMLLPLAEAQAKLTGGPAAILDNIDFDATARFIGIKADLPPAIFTPIEQMMQDRQARQAKIEQAQKAEMAGKLAPVMGGASNMLRAASDAKAKGMLGFDEPLPIPAPGIGPGMENEDVDILEGLYEEVA